MSQEELDAIKAELEGLIPRTAAYADRLVAIDTIRHKVSTLYSNCWNRQNQLERRYFELSGKIKQVKACGPRKISTSKAAAEILKALTPAQLEALKLILSKGVQAQKAKDVK